MFSQASWFSHLSLRSKLRLILLLPLICLLMFASTSIYQRWQTWQQMQHLEKMSELIVHLSALIHETQKERGLSTGFLGTEGQQFQAELKQQYQLTDQHQQQLKLYLKHVVIDDQPLKQYLSSIQDKLSELDTMRLAVKNLHSSFTEVLDFYSTLNALVLDASLHLVTLSHDVDIHRIVLAYVNLLHHKEKAGIKRALLNATFAIDQFAPGLYQRFIALRSAQHIYTQTFISFATPEAHSFYRQQVLHHESQQQVAELEAIALNHPSGGFSVKPSLWFQRITVKINQLKKVENFLVRQIMTQASQLYYQAKWDVWLAFGVTVFVIGMAVFIAYWTARSIYQQLGGEPIHVVEMAEKITEGDLRLQHQQNTASAFGLYASMNKMRSQLRRVITEIQKVSMSVSNGSQDINSSAQELSHGAEQQNHAAEQVALAMTTITNNVQQAVLDTQTTDDIARHAAENALSSHQTFVQVMQTIRTILEKVEVVDEIASRTNLLSINTSIEAAHLGQQGKGFMVIAQEIRHLAERSRKAAADISTLSTTSLDMAEMAETMLNQLVDNISETSELVSRIRVGGEAQSQEAHTVNRAMQALESVIQKNASFSEELASTAAELNTQAKQLKLRTVFFKTEQ